MQVIKEYKTKAKWTLGTLKKLPVLGYYSGGKPADTWSVKGTPTMLQPGMNLILEGTLFPTGVGRGRSSVSFYFDDKTGRTYHLSASGTNDLLDLILSGDIMTRKNNGRVGYYGFWTCSKQGTEVTLTPMKKENALRILA